MFGLVFVSLGCAAIHPTAAPQANDDEVAARTVLASEPRPGAPRWPVLMDRAPDPAVSCVTDDECSVVEMGCCDHCNGGWQLAVNRDLVVEAKAQWQDLDCATEVACPETACATEPSPICDGGVCARREERLDATGNVEVAIVRNVLPAR